MHSCSELLLDAIAAVKKHQSRRASRPRASRNVPLPAGSTALTGKPAGLRRSEMYCHISSARKVTLASKEKSQFSIQIAERRKKRKKTPKRKRRLQRTKQSSDQRYCAIPSNRMRRGNKL